MDPQANVFALMLMGREVEREIVAEAAHADAAEARSSAAKALRVLIVGCSGLAGHEAQRGTAHACCCGDAGDGDGGGRAGEQAGADAVDEETVAARPDWATQAAQSSEAAPGEPPKRAMKRLNSFVRVCFEDLDQMVQGAPHKGTCWAAAPVACNRGRHGRRHGRVLHLWPRRRTARGVRTQ